MLRSRKEKSGPFLKQVKNSNVKNLLIITEDYEAEEQANWFGIKCKVTFTPLWKWLTEN